MFKTVAIAIATTFVTFPNVAAADITPKDVWDNMVAYTAVVGGTLSGTQNQASDSLIITDLVANFPADFSLAFGNVTLLQASNGAVMLEYPEHQDIVFQELGEDTDMERISGRLTRTGLSIIATGVPGNITYETTAERFAFGELEILSTELESSGSDVDFAFDSRGLKMTTHVNLLDGASVKTTANHAEFSMSILANQFGEIQDTDFVGNDVTTTFSVVLPTDDFVGTEFYALVEDGMSAAIGITSGSYSFKSRFKEPGDFEFFLNGQASHVDGGYSFAKEGLSFRSAIQDLVLSIPESPEFPIPITAFVDAGTYNLDVPFVGSDVVQTAALNLGFENLTLNPELWEAFDPAAILSRAPANLNVDIAAGILSKDPLFGSLIAGVSKDVTPKSFSINDLQVSALGVELAGDGAFIFDGTRDSFFGDIPAPTGTAQFKLIGAHSLIDKLLEMEFLQPSDAFPLRAAIGTMTRASDAPDTLISEIEMDAAAGTLLVNGLPLQ